MTRICSFAAMLALGSGACATESRGTRPGDMLASQHLAAASEHSRAVTGAYSAAPYYGGWYGYGYGAGHGYWGYGGYGYGSYPWYYSWDPDAEHRALAAAHRDAADQLKLQFETACASVPRALEASSPLDAFATSTSPIERGIVFRLSAQAGPPEVVLALLRCHRAWLALSPSDEATTSPLLVGGVTWMTHAGDSGIEVMATTDDSTARAELLRRAALVVERNRKPSAVR